MAQQVDADLVIRQQDVEQRSPVDVGRVSAETLEGGGDQSIPNGRIGAVLGDVPATANGPE